MGQPDLLTPFRWADIIGSGRPLKMFFKKNLAIWIKNLIFGWLIFCVGGVGSLTYFDGFLPGHEHGDHPFHMSVLEETDHHHSPLPSPADPEDLAQEMRLWLVSRFLPDAQFFMASPHIAVGLLQFFTSGLSDGYILTAARFNISTPPALNGSVSALVFTGRSARLAPPEKPPSII